MSVETVDINENMSYRVLKTQVKALVLGGTPPVDILVALNALAIELSIEVVGNTK